MLYSLYKLLLVIFQSQPAGEVGQPKGIKRKTQPLDNAEEPGLKSKKPCFTPRCPDPVGEAPATNSAWFSKLGLSATDAEILDGGEWLTDDHISAAQKLLRRQFPELAGL